METPPTPADGLMLPIKSQLQRFAGWKAKKTALSTDCGNSGPKNECLTMNPSISSQGFMMVVLFLLLLVYVARCTVGCAWWQDWVMVPDQCLSHEHLPTLGCRVNMFETTADVLFLATTRYLSKESWNPSHSHWLLQWSRLAATFFSM